MRSFPGNAVYKKLSYKSLILLIVLIAASLAANDLMAQGTAFTYQGVLADGAAPANGTYDLAFILRTNAGTGGNQLGPGLTNTSTLVSHGLFTVTLDFGGVFDGSPRFLEIYVRTNGASGFTQLNPRQAITPTPYAILAQTAAMAQSVPWSAITGIPAGDTPDVIGANATNNDILISNSIPQTITGDVTGTRSGASIATTLANTPAARSHLGLGTMATIGTNNPSVYNTTNYGTLWMGTNVSYPSSVLQFNNLGSIQWFYDPPSQGIGSSLFFNTAHPGGGELQITSEGSMSLNIGYSRQGGSVLQIGSSGPTHEYINIQYDCSSSPTTTAYTGPLGASKLFQFITRYNPIPAGITTNAALYDVHFGMLYQALDTNGAASLQLYNPAPNWNGSGYGTNANLVGGTLVMEIYTNGTRINGHLIRQFSITAQPVGATNVTIDFTTAGFQELNLSTNANFSLSLTNITNGVIQHDIFVRPGLNSYALAWPTNILWESPLGTDTAPTNIASSTVLHVHFTATGNANATNFYAQALVSNYLPLTDPDAIAFISSAGITNNTQKAALNALCASLKNHGLWAKQDVIYPYVGGNSNSHAFNLKDPTRYRITWHGGVTHDSKGITGNGTDAWGDTAYNPSTNLMPLWTQNSASMYFYNKTPGATIVNGGIWMGVYDNSSIRAFINSGSSASTGSVDGFNNSSANVPWNTVSTVLGGLAVTRSSGTDQVMYFNGASILTFATSPASAAVINGNIYVLCRNGFPAERFSNANLAFVSMGGALTAVDEANLHADVLAFETALGRQ
jgi:hypothetical protein